jgi:hypothetical protein
LESLIPVQLGFKNILKRAGLHANPTRNNRRCVMCNTLNKVRYMIYDNKTGLLVCPDPECQDVVYPPYEPYTGLDK